MPTVSSPVGVVVDAYTTGNLLPAAFARHGVGLVHVQALPEISTALPGPNLSAFVDNIVFDDDAVSRVRDHRPVCVVAGQDSGVALADVLSERLGLPTNGTAHSAARRDKYRMIERIGADGLHCARQFKSADPADLLRWAKEQGTVSAGTPFVVKPLSSAGTDRVRICRTEEEIESAARAVLAGPDIYGGANAEVLIQTYLTGTEYVVDAVSYAGHQYVCGVWRYHKRLSADGRPIYDRDDLLSPDEHPVPELVAYLGTVLDSLGIRFGSTHAEVIVTPQGPALVELGARMNGNMSPAFHDRCLGHNQADLTALAYLRPEDFLAGYADRVYTKRKEATVLCTATELDGVVESVDWAVVKRIQNLPTVHSVSVKLSPGDRIRPTTDQLSSPMRVFMTGGTREEIMADYDALSDLRDDVYRIGS